VTVETKPITQWKPHGPLAEDEQLYFLHIPKTAGTSLRTFLESHFDLDKVCPSLVLPDLLPCSPSQLKQYRLFCGHHGLFVNTLLHCEPVTLTVLRDPVARTISHYRHLLETKEDWLHERVKNKTLEEFVCGEWGPVELLNLQTRYLVLDDIQEDYFGHSHLRTNNTDGLIRKYSDPSWVEKAKHKLDNMAAVGIQERFNDFLKLLSFTFGWSPTQTFLAYNKTKASFDKSSITPKAKARIKELTKIDQEVYNYATELFEKQFSQMESLPVEESYRRSMALRPRLSSVHYGFDKAINGENWLTIERSNGQFARWTGPGTITTLDLPLETDKPLVLRFFVGAQTIDVIESVRVFANNIELTLKWWQMQDLANGQRTFEAVLSRDILKKNEAYCRLRFEVCRTVNPSKEWPGREDGRDLALYFFWLELFPVK